MRCGRQYEQNVESAIYQSSWERFVVQIEGENLRQGFAALPLTTIAKQISSSAATPTSSNNITEHPSNRFIIISALASARCRLPSDCDTLKERFQSVSSDCCFCLLITPNLPSSRWQQQASSKSYLWRRNRLSPSTITQRK